MSASDRLTADDIAFLRLPIPTDLDPVRMAVTHDMLVRPVIVMHDERPTRVGSLVNHQDRPDNDGRIGCEGLWWLPASEWRVSTDDELNRHILRRWTAVKIGMPPTADLLDWRWGDGRHGEPAKVQICHGTRREPVEPNWTFSQEIPGLRFLDGLDGRTLADGSRWADAAALTVAIRFFMKQPTRPPETP